MLTFLVIGSNLVLAALLLTGFKENKVDGRFDEITVKRINVVSEKGDSLRMVISNKHRQHPGILNGIQLPPREREAGIIFFNSTGDECGGLLFDGNKEDAGLVLSVDKFRDDQVMQLQYMENTQNYKRKYGLQLWDYPRENSLQDRLERFQAIQLLKTPEEQEIAYQKMKADSLLMTDRLFIGRDYSENVGLFIRDRNGIPRIRIYIDKDNNPRIEKLSTGGKVIK